MRRRINSENKHNAYGAGWPDHAGRLNLCWITIGLKINRWSAYPERHNR